MRDVVQDTGGAIQASAGARKEGLIGVSSSVSRGEADSVARCVCNCCIEAAGVGCKWDILIAMMPCLTQHLCGGA